MHIAVDLDDVCLDFVGGLRGALKKEYGVEIAEEDITDFNLRPFLDPILGQNWWTWMRERDWLWPNFPAVDGAIGSLETLRRQGHYLECVTSKPKWAEAATWKWMGKWRPPFQRVTIVDTKSNIRKVDVTDAELLIDDKIENVQGFVDEGRYGVLFDRPHNRGGKVDPNWLVPGAIEKGMRAKGWSEVLRIVNTISQERA